MDNSLKQTASELQFLTLAYNLFYDVFDEVMNDLFWKKDDWKQFLE